MSTPVEQLPGNRSSPGNGHSIQRWLALSMLCLEIGATGYLGRTALFSVIILIVAIGGALGPLRCRFGRQRSYDLIAGLGILFSVKYLISPDNLRYVGLLPSQQIAFTLSQFFLAMQAAQFFLERNDQRIPIFFPGLGVGALVCAAIVEVTPRERATFQLLCVGFAVLAAAFCNASRRFSPVRGRRSLARPITAVVTLVIVSIVGWSTATFLHRYEKQMDRFVMQFLDPRPEGTEVGFSDEARLGSVSLQKSTAADEIALRVQAPSPPTYLRGAAFDVYVGQQWRTEPSARRLRKGNRPHLLPQAVHGGNCFRISNLRSPSANRYTIWPSRSLSRMLFTPRDVRYLEAATELPTIDGLGILRAEDAVAGAPYSVYTDDAIDRDSVPPPSERMRAMLTPPDWALNDTDIQQLASDLFEGKPETRQKIGAVINYFRTQGKYSLEVAVPDGLSEDSVQWFLKENPPAHCEFFATGTVVLLRMAGVHCRYVTGFLITEQNPYGGSWTARNRDAHAWVEAWDGSSWIVIETTPADGIPTSDGVGSWQPLQEYVLGRMERIRAAWQQRRFGLIGDLVIMLLTTPFGLAYLTLLIVIGVLITRRRLLLRIQLGQGKKTKTLPAEMIQLQSTLKSLDKAVRHFAGRRGPAETLLAFATRLEQAEGAPTLRETARWYRSYSKIRYAANQSKHDAFALDQEARELARSLRRLRKSRSSR